MNLRFAASMAFLAAALVRTSDARACGGCFSSNTESQSTVVTGHRMAFSISPAQTILWDQIQYSGSPSDFAWVLPVKGGAVLELSTDAWFETLDAATSAQIVSPPINCPSNFGSSSPNTGCSAGCFGGASEAGLADSTGAGGGSFTPPPTVTVTHEGTVGPYETVTLHTNVPNALPAWLTAHGYAIDPSVGPIIDAYTSDGFDFIALRLQPGKGVQAMKPVRVVTSGASPSLPLRMVAAGTGQSVAITLFVIGEGRWEAQNFPNAELDPASLTWSFTTLSSNYAAARLALLAKSNGRTFNNAFANQGSLLSQDVLNSNGLYITVNGSSYPTLGQAYVQEGVNNGETSDTSCLNAFDLDANSTALVAGNCLGQGPGGGAGGGGAGGAGGAGTGGGKGTGGAGGGAPCMVPAGDIDASQLACGKLDDIAVALVGLHPADVWLTRLEAFLPRAALVDDLALQASADQTPISNVLTLTKSTGNPCAPTTGAAAGLTGGPRSSGLWNHLALVLVTAGIVLGTLARRRRRAAPLLGGYAPLRVRAR